MFEKDMYFSEESKLRELFNRYSHFFRDFEVFSFCHSQIVELKTKKIKNMSSQMESLYDVLRDFDLIEKSKEDFKRYLFDIHKIKVAKIREYKPKSNLQHESRVAKFQQKWMEMDNNNN
jgi:hypothetical protein